jgi:hypothetical protein
VSCGPLRKSVWTLHNQASKKVKIRPDTRLTSKTVAKLSNEEIIDLMGVVRKRKNDQRRDEKRKLDRLRKRMEKGSHKLEFESDVANIKSLLTALQPFIEERFGKGSEHCFIIEQFMKELVRKTGAPHHNDKTMQYCMSLVPRTSKAVYDELQKLFLMPTRRYTKHKLDEKISGPGKMEDSPRVTSIRRFKEHAVAAGLTGQALDMIISFDGMIMRSSAILSNRKETKNKLIGIHLVESDGAIEHLFDQYVKKVSDAANTKDERSFEDRMDEALAPNREHLVYYAKSMKPGVDLCFICAAYNLATVRAHHILSQLWETIQVLGHYATNNYDVA